jgi:hypothetical protein
VRFAETDQEATGVLALGFLQKIGLDLTEAELWGVPGGLEKGGIRIESREKLSGVEVARDLIDGQTGRGGKALHLGSS